MPGPAALDKSEGVSIRLDSICKLLDSLARIALGGKSLLSMS